jgi:hypothetical protein
MRPTRQRLPPSPLSLSHRQVGPPCRGLLLPLAAPHPPQAGRRPPPHPAPPLSFSPRRSTSPPGAPLRLPAHSPTAGPSPSPTETAPPPLMPPPTGTRRHRLGRPLPFPSRSYKRWIHSPCFTAPLPALSSLVQRRRRPKTGAPPPPEQRRPDPLLRSVSRHPKSLGKFPRSCASFSSCSRRNPRPGARVRVSPASPPPPPPLAAAAAVWPPPPSPTGHHNRPI